MGPVCNLACEYCFYLEKKALFGDHENYRMSDEVLSAFVANYIASQPTPVVEIRVAGRGADPPGDRFLQESGRSAETLHGAKTISNSLQTNGTLLTESGAPS